jgi:2,3-bisphosphoglycerate-independent phosphoglycerate mutase
MILYDSRGTQHPSGLAYTESNAKLAVAKNDLNLDSGAQFFARFLEREAQS